MSTIPPSDRTRAKGLPPSTDFWILPKYAKRTQLPPPRGIPSGGLRSEAQRPKAEGPVQSASPTAIPQKQTTAPPAPRTDARKHYAENEPNSSAAATLPSCHSREMEHPPRTHQARMGNQHSGYSVYCTPDKIRGCFFGRLRLSCSK